MPDMYCFRVLCLISPAQGALLLLCSVTTGTPAWHVASLCCIDQWTALPVMMMHTMTAWGSGTTTASCVCTSFSLPYPIIPVWGHIPLLLADLAQYFDNFHPSWTLLAPINEGFNSTLSNIDINSTYLLAKENMALLITILSYHIIPTGAYAVGGAGNHHNGTTNLCEV